MTNNPRLPIIVSSCVINELQFSVDTCNSCCPKRQGEKEQGVFSNGPLVILTSRAVHTHSVDLAFPVMVGKD